MTDERIQFDDREFRLNRLLDGDLSAEEARRLEQEAATDPELRRALEQYRRVDGWVRSKAGPTPEPDWDRFAGQVMWRCGAAGRSSPRWSMIRIMLPLAAAAALALAFLARTSLSPRPTAPLMVAEGRKPSLPIELPAALPAAGTETRVADVEFDRSPPEGAPAAASEEEDAGSFVIAAVGAHPLGEPLDNEGMTPTF